jgi:hypothetical protein
VRLSTKENAMNKKLMSTAALLTLAAAVTVSGPAAATPSSPGACNMLHTSAQGYAGMLKASDRGLANMMALVIASEAAGCTP